MALESSAKGLVTYKINMEAARIFRDGNIILKTHIKSIMLKLKENEKMSTLFLTKSQENMTLMEPESMFTRNHLDEMK